VDNAFIIYKVNNKALVQEKAAIKKQGGDCVLPCFFIMRIIFLVCALPTLYIKSFFKRTYFLII
jgi:hypothetical protein